MWALKWLRNVLKWMKNRNGTNWKSVKWCVVFEIFLKLQHGRLFNIFEQIKLELQVVPSDQRQWKLRIVYIYTLAASETQICLNWPNYSPVYLTAHMTFIRSYSSITYFYYRFWRVSITNLLNQLWKIKFSLMHSPGLELQPQQYSPAEKFARLRWHFDKKCCYLSI